MITLTERAAKKIKEAIAHRGSGVGIRIGIKTTGCSGLAYVLEYMDSVPVTRDWVQYESHGATVWINGRDHVYVNGLEVDYVRQGLNEGFQFTNPNSKGECGCGESFRV